LIALAVVVLAVAPAGAGHKSDSVVEAKAVAGKVGDDGRQVVTITLEIAPKCYLIASPAPDDLEHVQVRVRGKGSPRVLKLQYPEGDVVKDKLLGDYRTYKGRVTIRAVVQRTKGDNAPMTVAVRVHAYSQICCYVPATIELSAP
jgi:hypothetical protein